MANDLTASPYKVDTAAVVKAGNMVVEKIIWKEPATEGDNITITSKGREICNLNAKYVGTGFSGELLIPKRLRCEDLTVTVIDSGTLYIFETNEWR